MPDATPMIAANGTPRQHLAMGLIRGFAAFHGGRVPTASELARLFNPPIRAQSAAALLLKLRAAGHVEANGHGLALSPAVEKLRTILADTRAFRWSLAVCQGDRLALGALVARIDAALGEG